MKLKTITNSFIILLFLTLLTCFIYSPAKAQFTLCNKTSYPLNSSIAYDKKNNGNIITYGWWRLRPGSCKNIITDKLQQKHYYVYAQSLPTHKGETKTWSGDYSFCISEERFFTQDDQKICEENNRLRRGFFQITLIENDGKKWQTEFKEDISYNLKQAEIAGVQRMLRTLGYNISIDGSLGGNSQRSVIAYKKSQKLPQNNSIDAGMVDKLIEQSEKKISKIGLNICNKSNYPIWVALLHVNGKKSTSRGWWHFLPSACQKLINNKIYPGNHYFYAIQEKDNKEYATINGNKTACTNPVLFTIKNINKCDTKGYKSAKYTQISLSNRNYVTFNIIQNMFSSKALQEKSPIKNE